jgi:ribonuclease BN (tRNA processing enzyme)
LLAQSFLPVDAVALTHFHLDHWGDLVPWAWMRLGAGAPTPAPSLWIPPGGRDDLQAFTGRWGTPGMFELAFQVAEYSPQAPFVAAGFEIEAQSVAHYGFPAYGFRVKDVAGRVLGYSGDSAPCPGLRAVAAGADLFLCESTLASAEDDAVPRGHLSTEEALSLGDGRVLLTHRPASLPAPPGHAVAGDGLVVEI